MAISSHIKKIRSRLSHVMLRDREILSQRLKKIQKRSRGNREIGDVID